MSRNDGTTALATDMPSRLQRYLDGGEKKSVSMSADATIRSTGLMTPSPQYLNGKPTTGSIHDCRDQTAEH
jgi:hypothetical protein